jgi:hypothetical protein
MTFEGRPMSHRSTIRIAVRGPIEANGAIGAALRAGDPVPIPVPTSPETRLIGTIGAIGTGSEKLMESGVRTHKLRPAPSESSAHLKLNSGGKTGR